MVDLAIVGGGAAGIAAALEARARGIDAVILEASGRLGGRAHSVTWQGHMLDLGAGWLHSGNRNPLTAVAEQAGRTIDRAPTPWREQFRALGFSRAEQAEASAASEAFEERLRSASPRDDVAASALDPGEEWNPFIEALSGYLNGTRLEGLSAEDYFAYGDASTECNWRVVGGYGALIAEVAAGLDVRTGCVVEQVAVSASGVRLSGPFGSVAAKQAIIAVPTNVLARGAITFSPRLDDHLHAAASLPLGHVEKLFFALDDPSNYPHDAHLIGNPRDADSGSYMLRPLGLPVIEAFFGGNWVEGVSPEALIARSQRELGALLGGQFGNSLRCVAHSDWQRDPFALGSYSYARPGEHAARSTLATPVDGQLAFAGEATSGSDFSTVHGAWQSGIDAVAHLLGGRR